MGLTDPPACASCFLVKRFTKDESQCVSTTAYLRNVSESSFCKMIRGELFHTFKDTRWRSKD